MEIGKSLNKSCLLIKDVSETIKNESKEEKGKLKPNQNQKLGLVKAQLKLLMMPHSSTNFEIQKYYQDKPKFNDVYSINNLPEINDGAYIINLDEYELIGTHWIA